MSDNDLRSPLGVSAPRADPTGRPPTWRKLDLPCPNCGAHLCLVRVHVNPHPMLRLGPRGEAVSVYQGCPACTFAGPSMTMAEEKS